MKRFLLSIAVFILSAGICMADSTDTEEPQKVEAKKEEKGTKVEKPETKVIDSTDSLDSSDSTEAAPKIVTTESGLKYIDLKIGDGETAVKGQAVEVHYTGWLDDNGKKGKQFDSSVDRGKPFGFQLGSGGVIKGWDEGVAGMKIGGKRQLIIPPELGYGARGAAGGSIPANATLIFDVELISVGGK